jgi:hypothetical protein
MPTLKQLTCHIEHSTSRIPLKEYGTTYSDGSVESYVAIPVSITPSASISIPTPFCIRLDAEGYIAPGLAMFVFIDGVYQCNRNRVGLVWDPPAHGGGKGDHHNKNNDNRKSRQYGKVKGDENEVKDATFRVRQKEERRADGMWVGRPWRFEEFCVGMIMSCPSGWGYEL